MKIKHKPLLRVHAEMVERETLRSFVQMLEKKRLKTLQRERLQKRLNDERREGANWRAKYELEKRAPLERAEAFERERQELRLRMLADPAQEAYRQMAPATEEEREQLCKT